MNLLDFFKQLDKLSTPLCLSLMPRSKEIRVLIPQEVEGGFRTAECSMIFSSTASCQGEHLLPLVKEAVSNITSGAVENGTYEFVREHEVDTTSPQSPLSEFLFNMLSYKLCVTYDTLDKVVSLMDGDSIDYNYQITEDTTSEALCELLYLNARGDVTCH